MVRSAIMPSGNVDDQWAVARAGNRPLTEHSSLAAGKMRTRYGIRSARLDRPHVGAGIRDGSHNVLADRAAIRLGTFANGSYEHS